MTTSRPNMNTKSKDASMTYDEQRLAIAGVLGWVEEPDALYWDRRAWRRGKERCATFDIPDYPHDRNAMGEAKKHLKQNVHDYLQFGKILTGLCGGSIDALYATPAQEAEAFLRAKMKWTGSLYV